MIIPQQGKTIDGACDRGGSEFEGAQYANCLFDDCGLSLTDRPELRTRVRAVSLTDCEAVGCSVGPAIFEDVTVVNGKIRGTLFIRGGAFQRVTLRGRIRGGLATRGAGSEGEPKTIAFNAANRGYYSDVSWALDISEGEFDELDLGDGVPAQLVRRNRDVHAVVRRADADPSRWRNLELSGTPWVMALEFLLKRGHPDVVLVPSSASRKKFDVELDGLKRLRDAGVADLA